MDSSFQPIAGHQNPTGYLHGDTVELIEALAAGAARDVVAQREKFQQARALPERIYLYTYQRLRIARDKLEEHSSSAVSAQALHARFLALLEARKD